MADTYYQKRRRRRRAFRLVFVTDALNGLRRDAGLIAQAQVAIDALDKADQAWRKEVIIEDENAKQEWPELTP